MRRTHSWLALVLLGAACGSEPTGPNLLLVSLDTLRRDHVGAYGSKDALTPRLDALAARGLVHEAAFTTMPTTGPAHVSLFTGLRPSVHGVRRNGVPLPADLRERELAARLRKAGYATGAFVGSKVLARKAVGLGGFDVYQAPRGFLRPAPLVIEGALRWLDDDASEPVFLFAHLYDPHSPYGTAAQKRHGLPLQPSAYGWVDGRYANEKARAAMAERYATGVRTVDDALGILVDGVRDRLDGPLLIVVTADHGEALDEHLTARGYAFDHGEFLDPEQIRIPLVLSGEGVEPGRSGGAVSIRDLYTTLLLAAGLGDPNAAREGRLDLRRSAEAGRIVAVERRHFDPATLRRLGNSRRGAIQSHAIAASDGQTLAVIGENGTPTLLPEGDPVRLLTHAAAHLKLALADDAPATVVDPDTEEALRSLGYLP